MDRNTIIGLVLIFAIFFGFSWWNAPSEEEQIAHAQRMDSIAAVNKEIRYQDSLNKIAYQQQNQVNTPQEETLVSTTDSSVINQQLQQKYGAFANSSIVKTKSFLLRMKY